MLITACYVIFNTWNDDDMNIEFTLELEKFSINACDLLFNWIGDNGCVIDNDVKDNNRNDVLRRRTLKNKGSNDCDATDNKWYVEFMKIE